MHMFPQHHSLILDPLEERRLKSGRPATRAEIYQRHLRQSEQNAQFITHDAVEPATSSTTSRTERRTSVVENIRRSVSRALSTAADRIAPEAA